METKSTEGGGAAPGRTPRIIPRSEITRLVEKGHKIVIFQGMALSLDKWFSKHPGGELVILHMVGRDATDEMSVYHSQETISRMKYFSIGRIQAQDTPWINLQPPIQKPSSDGKNRYPDPSKPEIPSVWVEKPVLEKDGETRSDAGVMYDKLGEQEIGRAGLTAALVPSELLLDKKEGGCSGIDASQQRELLEPASCNGSPGRTGCRSRVSRSATPTSERSGSPTSDSSKCLNLNQTVSVAFKASDVDLGKLTRSEFTAKAEEHEANIDLAKHPSLDIHTQQGIIHRYRQLHDQVKEAGLYDCNYSAYFFEGIRYSILFCAFFFSLRAEWFLTSAVFLGCFWHQIMFSAHDAGHMAITHNFVIDSLIGMFVADFCCGLSIGWWKSSHNVHHLVTNHPEHDPDIQNVPLLVTSPSFFKSVHSSYYNFIFLWDAAADFAARYQRYTYYPIMGIARFNLYLLSWIHLIRRNSSSLGKARWTRPTELLFMTCYWYWFGYRLLWLSIPTWPLRIAFVLVSHIITFPLHIQITLSHFAMSTVDLGPEESFPQKMLRTTMDVDCPAWLDFIHGGLQFQAVHHLFPRVPRHNLRKVQTLVRAFCDEVGIEYKILGFVDGNKEVLGRLGEVAKQVEMLKECNRVMVERGEVMGHHH